jgi:PBSX family phage terminase large subunit
MPQQKQFLDSDKKFALFSGGIGSGKTHVGVHYVIQNLVRYPKALGFIGANDHKQLRQVVVQKVMDTFDQLHIRYEYNEHTGILKALGGKVRCSGLENFNSLRGSEFGWGWCDEIRDLKEEAWNMLAGRLRDKRGPLQMRGTSSPAGFSWVYDHFIGDLKSDQHELIQTTSYNNPFLPEGYIEALRATYDEKFFRQEIMGEFLNLTSGQVYRSFDKDKNCVDKLPFQPGSLPIWVGMDFNVNPMTAVLGSFYNDELYIFAEIYLEDANTYDMAAAINARFGHYGGTIHVVPDSTGKARKTSSTMSDHQILRADGFKVEFQTNPQKVDRYNCVNGLLYHKKLKIHTSCHKTIKDLQQVVYEDNPSHLTHISDALGYLCWKWRPLKRQPPPPKAINT